MSPNKNSLHIVQIQDQATLYIAFTKLSQTTMRILGEFINQLAPNRGTYGALLKNHSKLEDVKYFDLIMNTSFLCLAIISSITAVEYTLRNSTPQIMIINHLHNRGFNDLL